LQARISHDRIEQRLAARQGALQTLYASGGVIPDRGYYALRHAHTGAKIGELDEEFVWEARIGQVFTLGAQNWRIRRIGHSDVRVLPAAPGKPAPPFWRAEANQRGFHLSQKIGLFLERAEARLDVPDFADELIEISFMDRHAAGRLIEALQNQRIHTGAPLPHRHHLLMEETALGSGLTAGRQVICHTFWGGRVNRPLAIALESAWEERFGTSLQIFCTNDTISFLLPPDLSGKALLDLVQPDTLDALLRRHLAQTGFFGARFRECAGRALLLPRRQINQRMPLWLTRLRAQKLLGAVAGFTDFPILVETWRTCLQDEFDLPQLRRLLQELQAGQIARSYVLTAFPSPLARGAVWQQVNLHMYQGDAPAPEKGGLLDADLLREVSLTPGLRPAIDADLVTRFEHKRQRLAPGYAPDTSDEMRQWLKERLVLPRPAWQALLQAAARDHKLAAEELVGPLATKVFVLRPPGAGEDCLVARDLLGPLLDGLYRPLRDTIDMRLLDGTSLPDDGSPKKSRSTADRTISLAAEQLGQWLQFFGPLPATAVSESLGLPLSHLAPLLAELAEARIIVVGRLLKGSQAETICDQENFEALLRLSRKALQANIEARPLAQLALFLAHHQGLTQPGGRDDLSARLNQLLCWVAPAGHWESEVLAARLHAYHPDWLDGLLQAHDLRWIGRNREKILFCFQEELDLIATEEKAGAEAQEIEQLFPDPEGRYPFSALERLTQVRAAALNERLWQWVWQGKISNDTFAALRRGVETGFKMPDVRTEASAGHPRRPGRSLFQRWRGARPGIGNWFRLDYPKAGPEVGEDLLGREERNKERVRLLLDRYGILFRELLARELPMLRWRPLFRSLRLMELSGEVLSGHFFEGIEGLQFIFSQSLPDLQRPLPGDAIFWLNALDPACLCGLELSQLRGRLPRRLPGVHIVYHGAQPVIYSHGLGARLEILVSADDPRLEAYIGFFDHLLARRVMPLRGIGIQRINQEPAPRQDGYVAVLAKRFEVTVDPKEVTLHRRRT
jgi:ATP-dependent Lhr-like helicase